MMSERPLQNEPGKTEEDRKMISHRAQEILEEGPKTVNMPEKTPGVILFSDFKGDSVVIRIFRYGYNNALTEASE